MKCYEKKTTTTIKLHIKMFTEFRHKRDSVTIIDLSLEPQSNIGLKDSTDKNLHIISAQNTM